MFKKLNTGSQSGICSRVLSQPLSVIMICSVFLGILPITVRGDTRVPGLISVDTIWVKENGPYIIKDTVVSKSATLTIERGTKVVFEYPELYSLEIRGNLIINGSKDENVEFSGSPDALVSIKGLATIKYWSMQGILGLGIDHGTLNISSSTFGGSSSIWGEYSTTTIKSTVISHDSEFNGNAISLNHSKFAANDLVIRGKQNIAAALRDTISNISSSSVSGSDIGIMLTGGRLNVERSLFDSRRVAVQLNSNGGPFPVFNQPVNQPALYTGGIGNAVERLVGVGIGDFTIHNSSFAGNNMAIRNDSDSIIDATMNWWGKIMSPQDLNPRISNKVVWDPALTSDPFGPKCCSNVVFIPGIQGTRLHEGGNQLWEPNRDADVLKLVMATTSKTNVTVGGIIDKAYSLKPIYQPIIDLANQLVANGNIRFWQSVPYDWRQSPDDLVKNISNTIVQVASTSTTGKVSIVAHSYGGLIAKSVIQELERVGMSNLIDKLMLVASPEYGSAKALPALLHGYDQSIFGGVLLSDKVARALGQSIPSAHDLLPSDSLFDRGVPIAKFLSNPLTIPDSNLKLNVASINGRVASVGDLIQLFVKIGDNFTKYFGRLNSDMLTEAIMLHDVIDRYILPSNIQILRIAGWGIPTLTTTIYRNSSHCIPILIRLCTNTLNVTATTQDSGDGTVSIDSVPVASSTIYLDLGRENKKNGTAVTHAYIMGSKSTRSIASRFLLDQIPKDAHDLPEDQLKKISQYASYIKPDKFSPLYTITIHSPVSLKLCRVKGKCSDIPGTYYSELAGSKYIVAPVYEDDGRPIDYDIVLEGENYGVATLNIEAGIGEELVLPSAEIKDFLVSPRAKGRIRLNANLLGRKSLALELEDDREDLEAFVSGATGLLSDGVIVSNGSSSPRIQSGAERVLTKQILHPTYMHSTYIDNTSI